MKNYRCRLVLSVLCLSVSLFLPRAQAQQTYVQPMYEIHWTKRTVLISVPDNPAWAKADFQSVAQDWNQAQTWFLEEYEPNHLGATYTLELAQPGETPQVSVQYVQDTGQQWWGYTYPPGTRISIILSRFIGANYDLLALEEHELGHVLGLGDNCVKNDLMFSFCNGVPGTITAEFPSTLNLYAAYVEALSGNAYGNGDTVRLPSQIPYLIWYPRMAVPEFPAPTLLLLLVVPVLFVLRKRKRSVLS